MGPTFGNPSVLLEICNPLKKGGSANTVCQLQVCTCRRIDTLEVQLLSRIACLTCLPVLIFMVSASFYERKTIMSLDVSMEVAQGAT